MFYTKKVSLLLLPWSVFEKVRLKPKVSGTFCGSGRGSGGTWSTLSSLAPCMPMQTQSLYLHSFRQNFALLFLLLRLAALGAQPKAPPQQKRHWHLIFGASLNVGRPNPAGGCAGSGGARPRRLPAGEALTPSWHGPSLLHRAQHCCRAASFQLTSQPRASVASPKGRKDRQSCVVVAAPVIPGRTDVEVTPGKLGRSLGSPVQGGGGSCSALSHGPSASHRSPARSDTRHLRQRRAPALGWPGWMSVAPWKVKKQNKTKK